jgi:exopolyphosphatase/guanosine-5'-triphosphate,3'-diphosphate pyrophosphatase
VLDYLDRHGAELQWELTEPNERRRAVVRLAERFHYDAAHAHQVARLAVDLFDATQDLHGLDEPARERLEYAALLHDIGYAVAEKAHHKHSEYLVLHGLEGGFTEAEVRSIAAIARYHRKGGPTKEHANWASLDKAEREAVRRAAALLRVADGLDRSHNRVVASLRAKVEPGALRVELEGDDDMDLELWAGRRKADLFEEVFARKVELQVVRPSKPGKGVKAVEPRAHRHQPR